MEIETRMLISFKNQIAVLIDRRVLFIWAAICEEIYQGIQTVGKNEILEDAPELAQQHPKEIASQLKDFPLLLRIRCLTDGIELDPAPEVIVKWDNVSAINNLSDEQWSSMKKPPRKRRGKQAVTA